MSDSDSRCIKRFIIHDIRNGKELSKEQMNAIFSFNDDDKNVIIECFQSTVQSLVKLIEDLGSE